MRKVLLLMVGLMVLPALAFGQVIRCSTCTLGIWDDIGLNKNYGTVTPGVLKEVFVAAQLSVEETGITGLEFSVAGMRQVEDGVLITDVSGITDPLPNIVLGTVPAPADTSAATVGTGGINIAWPSCIAGGGAVVKITFLSFSPLPANKVFKVLRRYPPTSPENPYPLIIRCDLGTFTKVRVEPGCYVANWDGVTGSPGGCTIVTGVRQSTWTGMKELYR